MSLRGPLYGLKKFIENLLEPYGIILKGIKTLDHGQVGTKYAFIWDVERLPSEVKGSDDSEHPHIFRELCETSGATYVPYKDELICCGAGGAVRTADVKTALDFTKQKFESIEAVGGADIIVTPCPFCELQLDLGQVEIQKFFEKEFRYDVMHVVELLALAFGHDPDEFGLTTHLQYMQRKIQPNWDVLGIERPKSEDAAASE